LAEAAFRNLQQGFLAVQDWWDYATDHLRGLRPDDADRTRFMARQMLDLLSPSNFPALNPEIIEETAQEPRHEFGRGCAQLHA
jgi:polyhydroxyalkanoate synthase